MSEHSDQVRYGAAGMFDTWEKAFDPNPENHFPGDFWNYRRMIDWYSCPHMHEEEALTERLNIEKRYGRNNPFTLSMLYGMFQMSAEGNEIYSPKDVLRMKSAMRREYQPLRGDLRAAGDIANSHDKQILMIRVGTKIVHIDEHSRGTDLDQADYWVELLRKLEIEPWQFTIDGGGIGATVANYMENRLGYTGLNRFMANNLPTYDFQFYDRYTELHWLIKDMLTLEALDIPHSQGLIQDMRERQYVEMDGAKIKCEPKKMHRKRCTGRSPDYLDTLVYLFHDFPAHMLVAGQDMTKRAVQEVRDEMAPTEMELEAEQASRNSEEPFGELEQQPTWDDLMNNAGLIPGSSVI